MIDIRSFRDLVRLYYIFRRPFWIAFVVMAVAMVGGAFLMPAKFTSEARLLIKPGRENLTVPLDTGDRQTYMPFSAQRDPLLDDEKMLTGRPVLLQVARLYIDELSRMPQTQLTFKQRVKAFFKKVGNAVLDGLRGFAVMLGLSEAQSPEERLAGKFADKFKVTHGPGSSVMELSFVWDDPAVAQRILQTWVRVYTDERTTVLGRKSLVTFYDAKVRDADQQIESLKGQLRARLDKIDGVSAEERLTAITKRLNILRDRLSEALAERVAIEQGVSFAEGKAKTLPAEVVSEREVGFGPGWIALNTQLADLKRQRTDALRVYKDTSPTVMSLNESIASVEAQLKAEDRDTQRAERRTRNELGTLLARNQLEKSVRLNELKSLMASLEREREQLTEARRQVLATEPELARIEQALQVAEKSRLLYLDSLEKARIDQALDDNRINNVAVIEAATLNPARTGPKSLILLALALPAGLLVGLVVIYLSAVMDQRIHDGGHMESRFGVPLWSTLKDLGQGGEDNDFHASLHRIYGTLPLERVATSGITLGLASSRRGEGVSFIVERLAVLLQSQGLRVRVNPESGKAEPGEVVLLEASNLLSNRQAFVRLSRADLIVLVVEARASVVPMVDNALGVLRTAFRKVDGVILNRRRFEVPPGVLRFFQR